jgi:hypothetical protein
MFLWPLSIVFVILEVHGFEKKGQCEQNQHQLRVPWFASASGGRADISPHISTTFCLLDQSTHISNILSPWPVYTYKQHSVSMTNPHIQTTLSPWPVHTYQQPVSVNSPHIWTTFSVSVTSPHVSTIFCLREHYAHINDIVTVNIYKPVIFYVLECTNMALIRTLKKTSRSLTRWVSARDTVAVGPSWSGAASSCVCCSQRVSCQSRSRFHLANSWNLMQTNVSFASGNLLNVSTR